MKNRNVKTFMEELSRKMVPGNAIAIYRNFEKELEYATGFADVETQEKMTGDHQLYIYSCSKVTTVTAALQLLEKGKFLVTDPLYDYIPEFREMYVQNPAGEVTKAGHPITIRQLFNMTAGFTYSIDPKNFEAVKMETKGKMNTLRVIRELANQPLSFEPGTHWQYSYCHDVLAAVVEVISGKKFRDYVKDNIFTPLDMNRSYYHADEERKRTMASQYRFVPEGTGEMDIVEAQKSVSVSDGTIVKEEKTNSHIFGAEYDSGGAGIVTTVNDYVKLPIALANGGVGRTGERILAPGTIDLMRTNSLNETQMKDFCWQQLIGYGYGYGVRTLLDRSLAGSIGSVGEFGWGGAAGATVLVDPKYRLAVFYAHHMLNPREDYYQPRLRNCIFADLE